MIKVYSTEKLTKAELDNLLPIIYCMTAQAKKEQSRLIELIEQKRGSSTTDIESLVFANQARWATKIRALGGTPNKFYEVSFATTDGTFKWKHGQSSLIKNTNKQRRIKV